MIRNSILLKSFAVFLIIEMLTSTIVPTLTWALTAGPTAPEATSFEPVDTTDIVDLKTGDFVYNIPLLEVPGPAGGYPLSLSYHAGILPDQESSWCGLGFTLSPGSISRMVNGYPDDHNNVTDVDRSYWKGGNREQYTVGVSYGIANAASVSAGLIFAQDTYKGSGVGGYVGVGLGYQFAGNVGIGINATSGVSAYGDPIASAGISVGISSGSQEALNISANLGVSINSSSGLNAGASTGIGVGRTSLLGASISTDGSKPSLSAGGGSTGVYNAKQNNVSVKADNFQIDIPIYYGISLRLGRDYQRYWIDETATVHTFGSLYSRNIQPHYSNAFDTYDLTDFTLDPSEHNEPEKGLGGSFPDVDLYTVTGQGISGNIRPYHFQKHLYRQDKRDPSNNYISKSYPLSLQSKPVEFRFVNDFSNKLEYMPVNDYKFTFQERGGERGELDIEKVSYDFDDNIITGTTNEPGYDKVSNHLGGSKHIEWYTNLEILQTDPNVNPFTEGFIGCRAEGFQRSNDTQIGGYAVTNASGVTYHYALPAYSFDEYMKTINSTTKQDTDGERWSELKKPAKYAYTWYLTAVTGPDYIDKNSNHLADEGDWGYWVNFEYKKWMGDYKWRNPGEGTNRDIDGEFEFHSSGQKEIYYLNKIITQTHIAVFENSKRNDSREVVNSLTGGFEPEPLPEGAGYRIPRSTAKLDRIKLYNYSDYKAGRVGDEFMLRGIEFNYDYLLADNTPNSYSESNFSEKLGKLTLMKLSFSGKKGISLIPPISFDYLKNPNYQKGYVDVWGFYKSDFNIDYRDRTNDVIGRLTTDSSALEVDAWSLNEIKTSLGTSIVVKYESDQYEIVSTERQQTLRVKDVIDEGENKLKISFWEDVVLSNYFTKDSTLNIDLVALYKGTKYTGAKCFCSGSEMWVHDFPYLTTTISGKSEVGIVDDLAKTITITGSEYYDKLKKEPKYIDTFGNDDDCGDDVNHCTLTYDNKNAYPDFIIAGIVSVPNKKLRSGGGIRVQSIALTNSNGNDRITDYKYEIGTTSYEPFQILEPKISHGDLETRPDIKQYIKGVLLKNYFKQINLSRFIPGPGVIYKFVTVIETNITDDNIPHELPNHTKYEFETFKAEMVTMSSDPVSKKPDLHGYYRGVGYNVDFRKMYFNSVTVKDYSARVGNLKSIILYNDKKQSISETTNEFLHDKLSNVAYANQLNVKFNNQGLVEETFSRARLMLYRKFELKPYADEVLSPNPDVVLSPQALIFVRDERNLLSTISRIETYPSVLVGQTNTNHKTGVKNKSENLAFNFFSGEASKVLATDSYGNRFLSVNVPAFENYDSMGMKINNKANKNMLTQSSENYTYLVDALNKPTHLMSASVQTWSDRFLILNENARQKNVWRVKASYQWDGIESEDTPGCYDLLDFTSHAFANWNNSSTGDNKHWKKTGELTLYDAFSHGLEATDINSNYVSTRMNLYYDKVICNATNARYAEMGSSSSEYYAGNTQREGGVDRGEGNPSSAHVHTGQYSLIVGTGEHGFNYTLSSAKADLNKKYRASVWVYLPGDAETQEDLNKLELYYTLNGKQINAVHPFLQKNKSKSWYLLNLDINPVGNSEVFIGVRNNTQRGAYFDDFRVHPLNGSLTSYIYNPFSGELDYMLDGNNFYTKFEYDAMGRLVRTSRELLNFDFGNGKESFRADAILREVKYNYGKNNK